MSPFLYKAIHLIGVIAMFIGLAVALMPKSTPNRKTALGYHGVGLFLILLGGFGLLAKMKYGFPWWILAKLVLWFGFGAMPILGKRGVLPAPAAWGIALACGVLAVLLGVSKGNFAILFAG